MRNEVIKGEKQQAGARPGLAASQGVLPQRTAGAQTLSALHFSRSSFQPLHLALAFLCWPQSHGDACPGAGEVSFPPPKRTIPPGRCRFPNICLKGRCLMGQLKSIKPGTNWLSKKLSSHPSCHSPGLTAARCSVIHHYSRGCEREEKQTNGPPGKPAGSWGSF